jgi:putative membrane protein
MNFIIRLVLNAVALLIVAYVVPGVHVTSIGGAILAAFILGIVNAVLRPLLFLLTLPLQVLTLGLFTLVINALLFWMVGSFHIGLNVDGFGTAFIGALLLSIVSFVLSSLVKSAERV